ncbi:hypothetical protein J2Y73_000575 [Peribacillus frigoritolerans]|jgi:hypothetical protein|nr:hypothetical protein [Peribacillus frigoritolerans]
MSLNNFFIFFRAFIGQLITSLDFTLRKNARNRKTPDTKGAKGLRY